MAATLTPAKAAKNVMNHPNFKIRLGDKYDKGDRLTIESLKQRLDPIVEAAEAKREKIEADTFATNTSRMLGIKKHDLGSFLTGAVASGLNSFKSAFSNLAKGEGTGEDYKTRVPWLGAASSIAGNLLMNNQLDLPEYTPTEYIPEKATANLVNFGKERDQVLQDRDLSNSVIARSARNSGSAAGLMENTLAGVTGTQRTAGQLYGRSLENEGNANAQILNQTSQFNAAQKTNARQLNMQEKLYANQINSQNKMINAERADARTSGIMDAITGYGRDLMAADQYDTMLKIATPDNYKFVNYNDSPFRKLFGITAPGKRILTGTNTLGRELGGYIIPKSKSLPISFRKK